MKALWQLRPQKPELAASLSSQLDIHPSVAQVLINRGLTTAQEADHFFHPDLKDVANPFGLPDLEAAADCLAEAVIKDKKVGLFGDYDADGVTSAAIFISFFALLGQEVVWYLPDRLTHGYGLNNDGLDYMASQGVKILVTADCGTSDLDELAYAGQLGLEVILTDHHHLGPETPRPLAFVNPQRSDSPETFSNLSGVGVVFFLLLGLRSKLREKGFFKSRPEPNMKNLLDLVAVGALADVSPVLGQNRLLINAGLELLAESKRSSLCALARAASLKGPISARDVLFSLAPRINAAGRLGQAELGLRLLTIGDPDEESRLAHKMDKLNRQRQKIENDVLVEAEAELRAQGDPGQRMALVAAGQGWHPGVLGIVATRLSQRFHRPCFVLGIDGDVATGSGRSIESFHLHQGLQRLSDHLIRFGGHSQAAGLKLATSRIDSFAQALETEVGRCLHDADMVPSLTIDAMLNLDDVDERLLGDLERLEPFGQGNPEPLFLASGVGLISTRQVGRNQAHLNLTVRQGHRTWPAIAFNQGHRASRLPSSVNLAFQPILDTFRGRRRLKLQIKDIQDA